MLLWTFVCKFYFLVRLGFEQVLFFGATWIWTQSFNLAKQVIYCLSHASSTFCSGYFGDRVSHTICLDCPRTMSLLISTSQVARITGISYQHSAYVQVFCGYVFISLQYIPASRIDELDGNSVFNFLRNCYSTVFQSDCIISHPTSNVWGVQFIYVLTNTRHCLCFFNDTEPLIS
jgi:hypothetical protein